MKSLYVAWKQKDPGGWFPVGRLDADVRNNLYSFRYIQGARRAVKEAGFAPFDSFPDLEKEYVSGGLFPFFLNRVPNSSRPSFPEYLRRLDLEGDVAQPADPIDVLAVSEGRRTTDNLEVFPRIERVEGQRFSLKFFLHGLRYLPVNAQEEILKLSLGDKLIIALECNNPVTELAIQLQTQSKVMIGYAPHYLVQDLRQVLSSFPIAATVVRINPPPAPPGQRVLVLFEGRWPENHEPMSGEDFQPLVESHAFEPELVDVR